VAGGGQCGVLCEGFWTECLKMGGDEGEHWCMYVFQENENE
jgi:hypothetical protein